MFLGSLFLKSGVVLKATFIFSGKIPFSSGRLNIYFRGSLISPKHLLTTSEFISAYLGLSLVLMRRKPPLIRLLITSFLPLYCVFDLRNQ